MKNKKIVSKPIKVTGIKTISDVIAFRQNLKKAEKLVTGWHTNLCVALNLEKCNSCLEYSDSHVRSINEILLPFKKEQEDLFIKYSTVDGVTQYSTGVDGKQSYLIIDNNSFDIDNAALMVEYAEDIKLYNEKLDQHIVYCENTNVDFNFLRIDLDKVSKENPTVTNEVFKLLKDIVDTDK